MPRKRRVYDWGPERQHEKLLLRELRADPATLAIVRQPLLPSRRRPDLVAVMATPEGGACLLIVELKAGRANLQAVNQLLDYVAEIRAGLDALGVSMPVAAALAAEGFTEACHAWVAETSIAIRLITLEELD